MGFWLALMAFCQFYGDVNGGFEPELVACAGYDLVAFVEGGDFVSGDVTWHSEYHGLIYLFQSEAHLKIFDSAPQKYDFDGIQKFLNSRQYYFMNQDSVALEGYDLVAYFVEGRPQMGSPRWQTNHDGLTYWFTKVEHLAKFKRDPELFLPQFGGWCAFGLTLSPEGYGFPPGFYKPNPTRFLVQNGRLYLFQNNSFVDGRLAWVNDEKRKRQLAESFWYSRG